MTGILVLVVGPSGAGKDTLIARAKAILGGDPAFVFPRRKVTRAAMPDLEDHDTMSWEEFATGDYAIAWEAHGLGYALPNTVVDDLAAGRTVVANVSRKVIATAADRFRCAIVVITANPKVRAQRLSDRGREGAAEIAARLDRTGADVPPGLCPSVTIDNSGAIEPAVATFVAAVRSFSPLP